MEKNDESVTVVEGRRYYYVTDRKINDWLWALESKDGGVRTKSIFLWEMQVQGRGKGLRDVGGGGGRRREEGSNPKPYKSEELLEGSRKQNLVFFFLKNEIFKKIVFVEENYGFLLKKLWTL